MSREAWMSFTGMDSWYIFHLQTLLSNCYVYNCKIQCNEKCQWEKEKKASIFSEHWGKINGKSFSTHHLFFHPINFHSWWHLETFGTIHVMINKYQKWLCHLSLAPFSFFHFFMLWEKNWPKYPAKYYEEFNKKKEIEGGN